MQIAKLLAATAALSLAASPALAASAAAKNGAAKASAARELSLSKARASTTAKKSNSLAPAILIGVLATVAIIGGAVVLADSDDSPDSP